MAVLTAERRLFMNFGAPVTEVPVGAPGNYFTGAQLVAVGGNIVRQGGDEGSAFVGFVRRTRRAAYSGDFISVVNPNRVWLPLPAAAHSHLYSVAYSAIDDATITLNNAAAGATAMGLVTTVDTLRENVLVDLRAAIPGTSGGGGTPVSTHVRYFGWKASRVIDTADLASLATSTSDRGQLPTETGAAYIVFVVPADIGYPSRLNLAGSAQDLLPTFDRQSGTIDDTNGVAHLVGVSQRQQLGVAYGGKSIELVY